nr:MAG: hypothetical protein [White spot syndrome virus]
MAHKLLFLEEEDAKEIGTLSHPEPSFALYESETFRSVGFCKNVTDAYPKFLPRPMDINSVQALAVRLALIQFYKGRGWKKNMSIIDLVKDKVERNFKVDKKTSGGFIIGDGTGVGKTRELAAFVMSVILQEKALLDVQKHVGPSIFGQDSDKVITAINSGVWKRHPFFIWLTCSKPLFNSCQQGMREVVTNSRGLRDPKFSWRKLQVPCANKPTSFKSDGKSGSMTVDVENSVSSAKDSVDIRFFTLRDVKEFHSKRSSRSIGDFLTETPTILFMTYSDLRTNLEFVLKFITGGTDLDSNKVMPIDNFVTALLCDEFHKTQNISDSFRKELAKTWEEEDTRVLRNIQKRANPSVSDLINRFKSAMSDDRNFKVKRMKSSNNKGRVTMSNYLKLLSQADAFRIFLEILKYDTFTVMASATPFQSNADLHMIDHILRKSAPAYTSIQAFKEVSSATPDAMAEHSEYVTVFLEQVIKLLRNRGQLVSRSISMAGVDCSTTNCKASPLQKYAIDELASYCLNARQVLIDSEKVGGHVRRAFTKIIREHQEGGILEEEDVEKLVAEINSPSRKRKRAANDDDLYEVMENIDRRFKVVVVRDRDVAHDGKTTLRSIVQDAIKTYSQKKDALSNGGGGIITSPEVDISSIDMVAQDLYDAIKKKEKPSKGKTDFNEDYDDGANEEDGWGEVFDDECFEKLRRQYFINTASTSVAACKGALLNIKATSVTDAVKRLRTTNESKKMVMSLEQTGDSFLKNLTTRILQTIAKDESDAKYGIVDVGTFDSSPVANTIFSGYRLLCRAVMMASAFTISLKNKTNRRTSPAHVMLVPSVPDTEPLMALAGNPIDSITQSIGEDSNAEITNRKLCSRITNRGLFLVKNNTKTANTNKCISAFNNTKEVDVIMLGPKGNTGLSLHDSSNNSMYAKRYHCVLDVPYNAIAFLQTIGRTHRNGQLSVPQFLIFSTDSPAERRFFDSLDKRIKDSKAGTYADRYSNNSIDIAAAVMREQFIDQGLVLKTMGNIVQIVTASMTKVHLMEHFSKMMMRTNRGGVAFVEGLTLENGIFTEVIVLAMHIALVVIGAQNKITSSDDLGHALSFTSVLPHNQILSIVKSASQFVFSNLCLHLVHFKSDCDNLLPREKRVRDAASALIDTLNTKNNEVTSKTNKIESDAPSLTALMLPSGPRNRKMDVFSNIMAYNNNNGMDFDEDVPDNDEDEGCLPLQEENATTLALSNFPHDYDRAIKDAHQLVTVRIVGQGEKEGVIPISECLDVPELYMTNLIPVVTATNVIQSLAKENPGLLFTIHNAALAHSHREGYGGSHLLGLAKKLSRGFINFRQFQNQLFSPKKESKIMYDIFLSVKAIMARDDRYDGLCDMRMNSMMDASFLKVRKKPECVFITKLLDKNFRRHIINDEEEETRERFGGEEEEEDDDEEFEDEEEEQAEREWGEEEGESAYDISVINDKNNTIGHDVDIILCNRKKLTLTKENSVFVNEHIDSFMVGNLIGAEGSLIQICFDNCTGEFEGLPKFCLYDSSSKDKDTIP